MKTDLQIRCTQGATIYPNETGYRLEIPKGDHRNYRVAQLDDYTRLSRRNYPAQPPVSLSLRARVSSESLPGTWGFGLWNDPFGLSLGFGGEPLRLPALPNAIWFFHASQENHLSFREKPGHGFLAQVFRAPALPVVRLVKMGLTLPFSRTKARAIMSSIIEEDAVQLKMDVTKWHTYRFEWGQGRSAFWVDDGLMLETPISPSPPLGLVIWIDNQYAAWQPDGRWAWGLLENDRAWLEIANLT